MWTKIDKVLSDCSDHHMPVLVFIFIVGAVLAGFNKLTQPMVEYAAVVVGAVTGHAIWSRKSGDE